MRSWMKDILLSFMMGAVLPAALLFAGLRLTADPVLPDTVAEVTVQELPAESPQETSGETGPETCGLSVLIRNGGEQPVKMDMDGYLVGAVLAEMPAVFDSEALKAQSVAARTFALRAYTTGGKHGDSSVCTDPSCCQAYILPEEYMAMGGAEDALRKVENAVRATSGLVLTYEGALIEATYFSCSGGRTEDAVAVWGTDLPYLRSVESSGEEGALHYSDTAVFAVAELEQKLGIVFGRDPDLWFSDPVLTQGGGVETIVIAGTEFTGTQLRRELGLRSTAFTVETDGMLVTFATRGYGHRVGMSQYGAEAMAVGGSGFEEILAHYYPGTLLEFRN